MFLSDRFPVILRSTFGIQKQHRILVAVSGGVDSICMLDLFAKSGYSFGVAHCNFQLRGNESHEDASWVREKTKQYAVPFYEKVFDTKSHSSTKKTGIQETARNLRYEWFGELCLQHDYHFIATAHHANDNAETVLLNITRGAGIQGLKGIPVQNGMIIRPLLSFQKEELLDYARQYQLDWRDDSSNEHDHYSRNYIRHHTLKGLEKLNPAVIEHINTLSDHAAAASRIIDKTVEDFTRVSCVHSPEGIIRISIPDLLKTVSPAFYLYHIIHPYGYNSDQVSSILSTLDEQSGKQFSSGTYQLIKDRSHLIMSPLHSKDQRIHIPVTTLPFALTYANSNLLIEKIISDQKGITHNPHTFFIDSAYVSFSNLWIRNWENGDKFRPLGMQGFKKISDYFIDKKISIPLKKQALVLLNGDDILALIPHSIDDRYKISRTTKEALKITVL